MITAEPVILREPSPFSSYDALKAGKVDVAGQLSFGDASLGTYWKEGDNNALARAVHSFRAALCQSENGTEERIRAMIGLADALRLQAEEGMGSDITHVEALSLAEQGAALALEFPALYSDSIRVLGEALFDRTKQKTVEAVQHIVDTFRQLVDLTSDSPPETRVRSLALYAQALNTQQAQTGDVKAMELANSAVDLAMSIRDDVLAPDADLDFAFTAARGARSVVTGNLEDVEQAIYRAEQFISNCSPGHPWLVKFRVHLGVFYETKSRLLGEAGTHDDRALVAYSEARSRVRFDHPLWPSCNGNYAVALCDRFMSQSNLEDLNEAITITRSVVSRDAKNGYQAINSYLYVNNLTAYLGLSYAQSGNLDILDESVALLLDIVDHVPPSVRCMVFANLGRIYNARHKAHGRISDLENAISFQEQSLTDAGGPNSEFVLGSHDLAVSLLDRFDELGRPDDMERVISVLTLAIEHPRQEFKPSAYSLLGHVLLKKGAVSQDIHLVDESIMYQRKALDLFPEAHSERLVSYRRLGAAEYRAFSIDQRSSALQNSIDAFHQALTMMSPEHPDRAAYLLDLATSQLAASDTREAVDVSSALGTLEDAARHAHSWSTDRYAAASLWARQAHKSGKLIAALEGYRLAISTLPEVAWLGLEDELRVQRLSSQPQDISQDAAACAIELGQCELAVELLDASRSVLWNTSQELRAEMGKLRDMAPDLARELTQTNAALIYRPNAAEDDQDERLVELERRRLHRLATRRTDLLHQVRSIPGFQNFLVPPSYAFLRQASRKGPVVLLIPSRYRCDALILQADKDVTLVPLSNISHRLILEQAQLLQNLLRSTKDRKGQNYLDRVLLTILRSLWVNIGRPICTSLAATLASRPLPRLWWCPTGAMTMLPIHACGPYNGSDPNMPDLVVSSYTPTVAALLRSQAGTESSRPSVWPRVLVVSEPQTLNHPPLPCALDEARILDSLIPSHCTFSIGSAGTVARIKEMLRHHTWFHVSSHGSQDSSKPLESSIALYDGDIKLSDLAHERIPNAEFAFLSACHSAKGTQSLPDEAMHLAAGMMFAGFKSVVATSWAIADKDSPVVAKAFYKYLIRDGQVPKVTETAEALHFAVKQLRKSGVPLSRWVPFIHFGA